jgi:hypothetical protein
MMRIAIHTVAAALALSAVISAAEPKFTSTWKSPEAAGVTFSGKKVAALIISDDQSLRVSGEEALVRELGTIRLIQGVATYKMIPREELRDPEKAKGWYERAGVDGVVAMRLVRAETLKTWTPSVWVSSNYSSFSGYYGYGWSSLYAFGPGRNDIDRTAVVETLIFSLPKNSLLWAGVTELSNPKDAQNGIKDIVAATVKEMTRQGLIRKGAN